MARSAIGREIAGRFNVIFSLFGKSFISCGFSCADSPSHGKVPSGGLKAVGVLLLTCTSLLFLGDISMTSSALLSIERLLNVAGLLGIARLLSIAELQRIAGSLRVAGLLSIAE